MSKKLISVIIPVLNEERHLPACLEALKKQTYSNVEIIVVDNGSTDKTVEIAKKYTNKVYINTIAGITFAKNTGLENASGDIIAFTDADCIPDNIWLEELSKCLDAENVVSAGGATILPDSATSFERCVDAVISLLSSFGARYGKKMTKIQEVAHNPGCNVAYKKNVFSEIGKFDTGLLTCEDAELDYRILKAEWKILFTPAAVVVHRRRSNFKSVYQQAYRYAIGRMQAIRKHLGMAKWFHFLPSLNIILLLFSFILLLIGKQVMFTTIVLFDIFVLLTLSIYLSLKGSFYHFYVYFILLFLWIAGWGIGFITGLWQHSYVPERKV